MSDGYQGLSKSDKWGCAIGALVGIPVFLFLIGHAALGDCAPDPGCRKGFFTMVLLPTVIIVGATFWAIRALLRARGVDDA